MEALMEFIVERERLDDPFEPEMDDPFERWTILSNQR